MLGRENKKNISYLNISVSTFNSKGQASKSKVLAVSRRKTNRIISIQTEQGAKIRATPNHPFFVIQDGKIIPKSAEQLSTKDFVAVPRYINCETTLQPLPQTITRIKARNSKHITLPPYCTEEFARLLGYLVGDGYCAYTQTSDWITLTGNDEELHTDFSYIIKKLFSINTTQRKSHKGKTAKETYATSKELIIYLEQISPELLQGARKKIVPDCILKSPLNIIAAFIRALFDCDGTVRSKRREISLTSANRLLIEQLRLLLKRFGISSQIHTKYQCATNSIAKKKDFYYQLYVSGDNVVLFSEYIGFTLKRKQQKIQTEISKSNPNIAVIPNIGNLLKELRTTLQISQSELNIPRTTYEHYERCDRNPTYHSLKQVLNAFEQKINNIYSQPPLLQQTPEAITTKYTVLKLLAESHIIWEKILFIQEEKTDEFVYDLEVEDTHNFIANGFIVHNSQLLKRMTLVAPKARYVTGKGASLDYNEPILIRKNNIMQTTKIGKFVDDNYLPNITNMMIPLKEKIETLALNKGKNTLEWKPIKYVYKHRNKEKLFKFTLETGRQITTTGDHSIFILQYGEITTKPAKQLQTNDCIIIPRKIKTDLPAYNISLEAARLLGYFIAEGHLCCKDSSYRIQFTLNKKETQIMSDINQCAQKILRTKAHISKHGENGARVTICGKQAYTLFTFLLDDVTGKKAKQKHIPSCIINAQKEAQQEFIKAYIAGDAGVTKSRRLMSDLLYLFLQQDIIASTQQRNDDKDTVFNGRIIHTTGDRYDLKSPKQNKKYSARYNAPPFTALQKATTTAFFKEAISSGYAKATPKRAENTTLLKRLTAIINQPIYGTDFKKLFGECTLEYATDHPEFFQKQKIGRQVQISITEQGKQALQGLEQIKKLCQSDLGFAKIKNIERVEPTNEFVYDISVPESESFVGGFGGIICHNSGAGLSATVVKDEFLQGWSLEAGALVLANKGVCAIDEMDKMAKEDTWAMHEALEQQSVTISKANIQATLRCETTVLAAANPKFGRFDPYETVAKQINLPPTLINRFDLIFVIKDLPDVAKDERMAKFILNLHQHNTETPEINTKLLRKYIAYARQHVFPKLTDGAITELQEYYIKMRSSAGAEGVKAVPISARQLEGLVRLSEASAKMRLSEKVLRKDARKAIELMDYCLRQVAFDEKTGTIDIDRIATEMPASQRNKIITIKEAIAELENKLGKTIPVEDVIKLASEKGIGESEVEEILQKLKKAGDIFEPRQGFVSRI